MFSSCRTILGGPDYLHTSPAPVAALEAFWGVRMIIKNATRLTRFSSFCSSYCSCGCCRRTSSTFSSDYENDHRPPSAPSMVEENGPSVMAAQHPTCQQYQRCIHAHNVSAATTLYSRTQRVSSTSAVFTYTTCEQYQHCIHVHV